VALAGGRAPGTWLTSLADGEGGTFGAVVTRRVDGSGGVSWVIVRGIEIWRYGRKITGLRAGEDVTERVVDAWGER
jgi:hypothetical protein